MQHGRDGHEQRSDEQCGEHVGDPHLFKVQKPEPETEDEYAAGGCGRRDHPLRHHLLQEPGTEGYRALDDEYGAGREHHAPPEHGRERERRYAVEDALEREQAVVSAKAVLYGAEDRHRADAEEQTRGYEGPADLARPLREAGFEAVPQPAQPGVYVHPLPDQEPHDHADERYQGVLILQEILHTDEQGDDAYGVHGRLTHLRRETPPGQGAYPSSGEDGGHVYGGPYAHGREVYN